MIKIASSSEKLTTREVEYWKKVFNANLLFASEIEFEANDYLSVNTVRSDINCTGDIKYYGNGVEKIKPDGSLRNGAEILTPPRRIYNFIQMYSGYDSLIEKLYDYDPYVSCRAGWHNHVSLQSIDGVKAQEKPVPIIILKNLLTLCKLYYPGLVWFSSTIPEEGLYTRYDEFCMHDRLLKHTSTMNGREIYNNFNNTRYNCINLNRMEYYNNYESIERFHIEFRFPDGNLFPSLMASFQILIKALILKSIELSRYGLISSETNTEFRELYNFRNNLYDDDLDDDIVDDNDWLDKNAFVYDYQERMSAPVNDSLLSKISHNSIELVNLLEDEITKIDEVGLSFCKMFSETPVSQMFKDEATNSIEVVNDILDSMMDDKYKKVDNSYEEIEKIISIGAIKNVENEEEWFNNVGKLVACKEDISKILGTIASNRKLGFNKRLGYYFL